MHVQMHKYVIKLWAGAELRNAKGYLQRTLALHIKYLNCLQKTKIYTQVSHLFLIFLLPDTRKQKKSNRYDINQGI